MKKAYQLEQIKQNLPLLNFVEAMAESNLRYFAWDVRKSIGYSSEKEMDDIIPLFIKSMMESNIDVSPNIKFIYRCEEGKVYHDWKLSALALCFLVLNAPIKTPELRRFQLKILSDYFIKN